MSIPNLGYRFAFWQGNATRRTYRALLPWIIRQPIDPSRTIDLDVFAYSNQEMLPEQVASIRSFLCHAGRPQSFTVVSDGSHSPESIRLLEALDPAVKVRLADPVPPALPEKLRRYLAEHPTGKQLALVMSLPLAARALYVDSDVRFFPGASGLAEQVGRGEAPAYYLADCQFSGDERLLRSPAEADKPVNTGALLLLQKLDWSLSIARFEELAGPPSFFTNQTMVHLTMHANGALPFDPRTHVLQLDDQAVYPDRYAGPELVFRHYVNPVRHKMWTSLRS